MSVQTSWQEESGLLTGRSFPARVQSGSQRSRPSGRAGKAERFLFLKESENFRICPKSQTYEEVSGWRGGVQGRDPQRAPDDLLTFKGALAERFPAPERRGEIEDGLWSLPAPSPQRQRTRVLALQKPGYFSPLK